MGQKCGRGTGVEHVNIHMCMHVYIYTYVCIHDINLKIMVYSYIHIYMCVYMHQVSIAVQPEGRERHVNKLSLGCPTTY